MKTSKIYFFIFFILLSISCNKEDLDRKNFIEVKTGTITSSSIQAIALESEILGFETGKIIEHGYVYSCLSENPEIGNQEVSTKLLGVRLEGGSYSGTIENLEPNTTYSIRAFALIENEQEANYGETLVHRSSDFGLTISTDDVQFIPKGFELFGSISNLDSDLVIEKYGFVWSNENETPEVEIDNAVYLGTINEATSFSSTFENVERLKNYHVRAFAQLGKDVFYGETISFFKGDIWARKNDVPASNFGVYFGVINDQAYIGGGYGAVNNLMDLQKYDPITDSWSYETPFVTDCIFGAAFAIEDTLFVVTGDNGIEQELWGYNTINQTWFQRADFPGVERSFTMTLSHQGKGYVCLGYLHNTQSSSYEIWEFNPSTNSWTSLPPFPAGHREEAAIFSYGSELFIGLGFTYNDLHALNTNTMEWSEKSPIPLSSLSPIDSGAFQIGDKPFVLTTGTSQNFWQYEPVTDTWKQKADFPINIGLVILNFSINGKGYVGVNKFGDFDNPYELWEYTPDSK